MSARPGGATRIEGQSFQLQLEKGHVVKCFRPASAQSIVSPRAPTAKRKQARSTLRPGPREIPLDVQGRLGVHVT
eukprot:7181844-Prymnesium_polylepis.1